MITFDFYFGLCMGQALYNFTYNMSKSLQSENISVISANRLTLLTKNTLVHMKSDENFQNYYLTIVEKAAGHPQIEQLSLPRKHKRTNYSILQFIEGYQSAESYNSLTVDGHYRSIYYERIDAIIQAIMTRLDRPNFKTQCFLQQLLLKGIQGHDIIIEISEIKNIYGDGINFDSLLTKLQVLKTIVKENKNHQTPVKLSRCILRELVANFIVNNEENENKASIINEVKKI